MSLIKQMAIEKASQAYYRNRRHKDNAQMKRWRARIGLPCHGRCDSSCPYTNCQTNRWGGVSPSRIPEP